MTYPSITLAGNIITFDTLEKVAAFENTHQAPADYGFESKDELRDQILFEWSQFKDRYRRFEEKIARASDDKKTGITRQDLLVPMLTMMDYEIVYDNRAEIVNDKNYNITHRIVNLDGFPVHIVGAHQSLDRKAEHTRNSPHALVQEYLNLTEYLYGLVTNGRQLRLLRNSNLLTKFSYLEFDLGKMVEEELYPDFVLMYLILHQSRMPQKIGADSIIEKYHQDGLADGSRIREKLSIAVEECIILLGDGLLKEPKNEALRQWMSRHSADDYYAMMLKLVYRMLFIMVIEERDLIFIQPEKDDREGINAYLRKKQIYTQGYSIERLRKLSEKRFMLMPHQYDVWENLMNTFQLFENRNIGTRMGIAPLGGDIFNPSAMSILYSCKVKNGLMLEVMSRLHQFEAARGQIIAINYKNLDVEEFGSVYEGLLEKSPVVEPLNNGLYAFRFVSGTERSSSGSHYTPDDLVQPLIKHSLEHLIQDILQNKKTTDDQKIEALLRLKVADIACGSGHILLAAARRIGLEIARLRTGEEQPAPPAFRQGVRDAIKNCIYGVDKNPYAVELCKVALWLEAHIPGEPLSFLDNRIRCGDALVGLAHFDELDNGISNDAYKKTSDRDDRDVINDLKRRNTAGKRGWVDIRRSNLGGLERFQISAGEYQAILNMPEHTLEQVDAKRKAYTQYLSGAKYLKLRDLANLQMAPFFTNKSPEYAPKLITTTEYAQMISGHKTMTHPAVYHATALYAKERWFHWFLEFPEVFAQGGFDVILGNPPFLGGQKISGNFGKHYAECIKAYFSMGSVDLVTYFFRRIYSIIREKGFQSLISTNTIAQGDARSDGLEVITQQLNGSINHAVRSMKWPGLAAVEVALVTIYKGEWTQPYYLNGQPTERINSYLDDQEFLGNPYRLAQNAHKSFQGSIVLGQGFVLEPEEAQSLIELDPKNKEVIFPYLNGQDLNNEIDQSPTRWVINFFDWPEEKAMQYEEPYRIIKEKVFPERQKYDETVNSWNKSVKNFWWLFGAWRKGLDEAIKDMDRVMVVAQVSKTVAFEFTKNDKVIAGMCIAFAFDKNLMFTLLQNNFHHFWVAQYASKLKNDLRYTPTDVFENFPFPQLLTQVQQENLETIGENYHEYRKQLMLDVQLGLTKLYNCFHSVSVGSGQLAGGSGQERDAYLERHLSRTEGTISYEEAVERIVRLRELHRQMDVLVMEAYGWHIDSRRWGKAIDLLHDFYEVDYLPENDRIRYTIHPDARKEVLRRLLLLNHEVHESEERGISYAALDKEKTLDLMKDHFSQEWNIDASYLQPGTLRFLTMAEELWPALSKTTARIYNAVVQHYGSALESELQEKLFIPFTAHMQQKYDTKELSNLTFKEKDIRYVSIMANKLHRSMTDYTLGNAHILLGIIDDRNHSSVKQSTILQEFRDFYFSVYRRTLLQDPFLSQLKQFIDRYRNEAAHTGEIDKRGAEECKEMVKELVRVMVGSEY